MRLDSVFQLSDDHGVTKDLESGEKAKKIRLRTGKRYKGSNVVSFHFTLTFISFHFTLTFTSFHFT